MMTFTFTYIMEYSFGTSGVSRTRLTLNLLTWKIWRANNVIKWQMGFNSAFKGLT
jgi:hypothetical protein